MSVLKALGSGFCVLLAVPDTAHPESQHNWEPSWESGSLGKGSQFSSTVWVGSLKGFRAEDVDGFAGRRSWAGWASASQQRLGVEREEEGGRVMKTRGVLGCREG